jgi:signal peptidase II
LTEERIRGLSLATALCGAVVALDQGAKALVNSRIARGDHIDLLPFLSLSNTRNDGVAFGLAGNASPVLIAVTVLAVIGLLAFLAFQVRGPGIWIAGGLLVGGALGNLADRVRDGAVTDFIDLPAWPTFNLADMAIVAGVVVLLLAHERRNRDGRPAGQRS